MLTNTVSDDELDHSFQRFHNSSDDEVINEDDASANARRSDVDGRSDLVLISPNELRLLFLIYISLVVSLMGLGCKEKRLCDSKLPKRKGHRTKNYRGREILGWFYAVTFFSYWSLPSLFYWTVKSLSHWFLFYWAVKCLSYWFSLSNCSLIQTLQL
ncbi:hypothetical protein T09_97 [Trichinella sp. T9]|nr:hypothetical protein T09_97 [Trichinella sp. T9]